MNSILLLCLICISTAQSKILWDGNASHGKSAVWNVLNTEGSGNKIEVIDDSTHGKVWKFFKPKGAHRCEGHGAKGFQAKEGDDIYIGWSLKLHQPEALKTQSNFQWKSYGDKMLQNHPFMFRTLNGDLVLEHWAPGTSCHDVSCHTRVPLWNTKVHSVVDKWHSIVLRIHVSRDAHKGFAEFWFDGKQQHLHGGNRYASRTLDGDHCDPKWGVYGGDSADVTTYVGNIKIATTFEEANPTH